MMVTSKAGFIVIAIPREMAKTVALFIALLSRKPKHKQLKQLDSEIRKKVK
jgi:hypothetical protein